MQVGPVCEPVDFSNVPNSYIGICLCDPTLPACSHNKVIFEPPLFSPAAAIVVSFPDFGILPGHCMPNRTCSLFLKSTS